VTDLVRHVCEVGQLRPNGPGCFDRFFDVEVGRVWVPPPQGIQNQDANSLKSLQGFGWKALSVGNVSEVPGPEPEHGGRSVGNRQRCEGLAQDLDRLESPEALKDKPGNGAPRGSLDRFVEDIGEPAKKLPMGPLWTEDGHVFLGSETKYPEVVGAVYMVGVKVRKPHGIDTPHALPHQLEPKLRWEVDHHPSPAHLEKGTMTCATVSGVVREAGRTPTTDDGDSEGRAGPEKSELHARLLKG